MDCHPVQGEHKYSQPFHAEYTLAFFSRQAFTAGFDLANQDLSSSACESHVEAKVVKDTRL